MAAALHDIRQWRCFQSGPNLKIIPTPRMALHSMFYDQKFVRKVKKSGWNLKVTRIMGGIIKTISMPWILPLNCMHLWLQIMKTVNIDRHNISYKHIYTRNIGVSPVRTCYAGQTMCTSTRLHPLCYSRNLSKSYLSKRKANTKIWEFSPFKWWRVFIYSSQMDFFFTLTGNILRESLQLYLQRIKA